ncbi:sugar phosphate nucleotidyltransferase, partial [Bacteroides cellulosilyticus]
MQIIMLSGGSGKRLWPLSNNTRAKQFIKLLTAP